MKRTLRERVWAKVTIPEDFLEGCWNWTGALSLKRAGTKRPVVWDNGRVRLVARVVCEWVNGPAPTGDHQAGHTCPTGENRLCVNPRHLRWQTPEENVSARNCH